MLRPPTDALSPAVAAALTAVPQNGWPRGLLAPRTCRPYLTLALPYIAKSHHSKELELLLDARRRTLYALRQRAIVTVTEQLLAWEAQFAP